VLPTPVLGVVGLLEHADRVVKRVFRAEGDVIIVLLGEVFGELGGSEYLKVAHGMINCMPPRLDLDRERALQRLLVDAASDVLLQSAHDCAEGGLAVTLAECCFDAGVGAEVNVPAAVSADAPAFADVAALFGESASRVIVSVAPSKADALLRLASAAKVPAAIIGRVGGERVRLSVEGRMVIDERRDELERLWATAIDRYFEPRQAIA
jgi:phosphoribosylformylglycinamidine synthase